MSRLQEDSIWTGIFVSLFITATMFYFFYTLNDHLIGRTIAGKPFGGVRERFVATLAVFFNIIPFIIYIRAKKDHAMHGVGVVTVILSLVVLFVYYL